MNVLQLWLYCGLALAALWQWRRRQSSAAGWLSAALVVVAIFFISTQMWLEGPDPIEGVVANVPIALLALFPYALYRFMSSFIRPVRWVWLAAPILTAAVAVPALALPDSGGDRGWVRLWVGLLLLQWIVLGGAVVVRLWRAGSGQPTIARRRMRTMSVGAAGLVLAAVVAGEFGESGAALLVSLLPLLAAPLLLAGFAPPFPLRQWWRREEDEELRQVELSLVEADDASEVAETLLVNARTLLGGVGAVLETSTGEVIASSGSVPENRSITQVSDQGATGDSSAIRVDLRSHRLTVYVSPFTPFFGEEEVSRLHALTALADVALERNILFDEQRFLAGIVESSSDAILTKSLDGIITSWNKGAEAMYGYRADEIIGRPVSVLVPPEAEDVSSILAKIRTGRAIEHYETKRRAKDGRVLNVALTVSPIRDRSGHPIGASTIARDVTEAARLQETLRLAQIEAERANSFKTEFLSRISHELRTPLNAILGFSQLLELDDVTPDQRDSIDQITKGGRRLLALINDILDISRIESGSIGLSLEPVSVDVVVRDAVALIKPLVDERGIQLRTETSDGDLHVLADQQRLGQALLNLLSNAVKYNVDRGMVSVTARADDSDRIRIAVTDTGPGIAEDKMSMLFAPFQRLGAEQTNVEGTGLGLSLSRSLVQAMGGRLEVDTREGEGTTFWIELKAARRDTSGPRPATTVVLPKSVTGKVLYIEDNLSNLTLIERLLEGRTEVTLISAMTGNLGLELAQQHVPDLILLDLHLPDLQGDAVLARLRKDPRTAMIPVVMLSADATTTQIERLLAAGARDYLTKPINIGGFLGLLDRFLERNQQPTGQERSGAPMEPAATRREKHG